VAPIASPKCLLLAGLSLGVAAVPAFAAVGCDLSSPDTDVPRLFPGSTSYKTRYINLDPEQLKRVTTRLDERYRFLYDPLNVPYTLYEIYGGTQKIGYIHGVNQKGQFGGLQVFVSLDLEGRITAFYIQKMTGQWAGRLRAPAFGRQFLGMALADFDTFDPASGKGTGRLAKISNPAPEMETDFYGVLRALKKNLVLMDEVVYSGRKKAS
jgi:hypothetical protein